MPGAASFLPRGKNGTGDMKLVIAGMVAVASIASAATGAQAQSFNCRKAYFPDEKLICTSPRTVDAGRASRLDFPAEHAPAGETRARRAGPRRGAMGCRPPALRLGPSLRRGILSRPHRRTDRETRRSPGRRSRRALGDARARARRPSAGTLFVRAATGRAATGRARSARPQRARDGGAGCQTAIEPGGGKQKQPRGRGCGAPGPRRRQASRGNRRRSGRERQAPAAPPLRSPGWNRLGDPRRLNRRTRPHRDRQAAAPCRRPRIEFADPAPGPAMRGR